MQGFNNVYNTKIRYIELKTELSLDNAWLFGFTDAEGCFSSSVYISKTSKYIVTVRYFIPQKDDIGFSKRAAYLLNGHVTYVKSYNGYNTVVNFGKLNVILDYLKKITL